MNRNKGKPFPKAKAKAKAKAFAGKRRAGAVDDDENDDNDDDGRDEQQGDEGGSVWDAADSDDDAWAVDDSETSIRTGARFFIPEDDSDDDDDDDNDEDDAEVEFDKVDGNNTIMFENTIGPDYTTPLSPPPARLNADPWEAEPDPWSRRRAHKANGFIDKYGYLAAAHSSQKFMSKYATPSVSALELADPARPA